MLWWWLMVTNTAKLGDLISITRGTTYKSALLGQPGPVLLGLASIARNGGFRSDSLRTYGGDSPDKLLVRPGELFASLKDVTQAADLLGSVARVPIAGPTGRLTQDTVRIEVTSNDLLVEYLYLALLTPQYRQYCRSHATGTTNLGLPRHDFLAYEIPLPSLGEQRRIASVLGAFDDMVEVNRVQISSARELARDLYAHASEGQPAVPFGEIASLARDAVRADEIAADTPYLALDNFATEGGGIQAVGTAAGIDSNKSRFRSGDVLYGKLRPYFRKHARPGFDGVCSTEIWVLRPRAPFGAATLDAIVSQPAFTDFAMAGSGGTRMPRANWNHVVTMPVAAPPEAERVELEAKLEELWRMTVDLQEEIADLTRTRNELLPHLMSGKVRVSESLEVA